MKLAHSRLKKFVHGKEFCHLVNYVIIAFAIVVGIETFLEEKTWAPFMNVIEYFFLAFFALEIMARIAAEDHPLDFFNLFKRRKITVQGLKKSEFEIIEHGFWNYFDFILIVLSLIGLFANIFVLPGFFQVGRLFRIFRIVRLLEISDHLKEVERRIVSILPTVFSFAVLLIILTYIYSIVGMSMFDRRIFATSNFSTILDSFITLFQIMTLDNWSDVMKDLKANVPGYPSLIIQLYFISYVILTSIVAFNVFIAVMTSQVQARLEEVREKKTREGDSGHNELMENGFQAMINEIKDLKTEVSDLRNKLSK